MNHSCYENVGFSKQTRHPTPVLHIQRQQSQHTKATHGITALFTVAASLHRDVWMLVSTWFACGTYQSSFASLVRGNVYFLAVATFISKVHCSLFFLHPPPQFMSFYCSGISFRAQRSDIWCEFSVSPGLCFPLVV